MSRVTTVFIIGKLTENSEILLSKHFGPNQWTPVSLDCDSNLVSAGSKYPQEYIYAAGLNFCDEDVLKETLAKCRPEGDHAIAVWNTEGEEFKSVVVGK